MFYADKRPSLGKVGVGLCVLFGLVGCASTQPSQFTAAAGNLQNGDAKSALMQIQQSGLDQTNFLYNLEYGEVIRLQSPPDIEASTVAFLHADDNVKVWEDETRTNLEKPLSALGSYFLSDTVRTFEGRDYEKSLLNHRLAINRLVVGDWESARVETRKLADRETLIKQYREKEVEALTDEAKAKNVATVPQTQDLAGYPVETLNDPQVVALKNAYQSATSHYLAGFIFESLGEPGLAAPGYRQAIELRPDVPFLTQALKQLDHHHLKKDQSDVLFVVETGALSPIESQKITVPLPLPSGVVLLTAAYPVVRPSQSLFALDSLSVEDKAVPLAMTTNIDAMSRREIKDEMPGIILRNATRMAITGAAQAAAQQVKDKNGQTSLAGSLISLAIGITSAVATNADTRHWTTLPAQVFLGRTELKTGTHKLRISTPVGVRDLDVDIEGKHSVVYLRVLGNDVVSLVSKPKKQGAI